MFKSLFTRVISIFMLILLLSFTVLTSILSTLVNAYTTDLKMNEMADAAYSVSVYLADRYPWDREKDLGEYAIAYEKEIRAAADFLAANTDGVTIFLADSDGNLVFAGGAPLSNVQSPLSNKVLNTLFDDGFLMEKGTLDGLFGADHCTYAISLEDPSGAFFGAVLATSRSTGVSDLLVAMNRTILMSTLWIMLAALVAVYFITERMASPLRTMSRAAKSFAAGKFDVRVPVTGSDEIAELAAAFNNMAESLAAADEMQRSFVSNVSHDLRTPMTTISGFIDSILSGAIPPEKQDYYLGVISAEVQRLSRLVSALLDISRMQAGERKFTMTSFDICELARQILISFEQKIDGRRLRVSFESDSDRMEVLADRDSVHQVLYNICDNAIKFADEGGDYAISVREKEKKIFVSVYNTGEGVAEADLHHIFDRFYKSDKSRGLDKTGVGLGMYISRTIIEAHGERIWAESVHGQWCRFTFTLPKAPARSSFREGKNQLQKTKNESENGEA